jgi:hypothetical protein
MISSFVDVLFGCAHKRLTFPMTTKRARNQSNVVNETYVACLRCGREFPYDWHRMKVVGTRKGFALTPRPESAQSNIAC